MHILQKTLIRFLFQDYIDDENRGIEKINTTNETDATPLLENTSIVLTPTKTSQSIDDSHNFKNRNRSFDGLTSVIPKNTGYLKKNHHEAKSTPKPNKVINRQHNKIKEMRNSKLKLD